jgi:ribonuclease HII
MRAAGSTSTFRRKIVAMSPPDDRHERRLGGLVAGVDEAGRGPWAGPVVAAAVILKPGPWPTGIVDSKALRPTERVRLAALIADRAWVGVGSADVAEIDRLNILMATMLAMQRAVAALPLTPSAVMVDGNRAPTFACPAEALVRGDALSLSIAAASIVAKVTRDAEMRRLAALHPGYGWEHNAGYGTPEHRAALRRLGPTAQHRRSFRPVRELLDSSLTY